MDTASKKQSSALFDVYLRLRPQSNFSTPNQFLNVEQPETEHDCPTHITIHPPASDIRRRAVEKFGFTKVFEEDTSQLDIFNGTTILPLIEGVLAPSGKREGRDALVATLGVTGSGKSHTILGSKSHRGITQMTLSVLYNSIKSQQVEPSSAAIELSTIDASEAQIFTANQFLDLVYGDSDTISRANSRAQTPMVQSDHIPAASKSLYKSLMGLAISGNKPAESGYNTRAQSPAPVVRRNVPSTRNLPQEPSMQDISVGSDRSSDYVILLSMYEVYNDKIFDLLTGTAINSKQPARDSRRRPLLFKSTELSPDHKVVAGLRKVICNTLDEALVVLETGLTERRVAGTGANAVSSRSHGFFGIEVRKKSRSARGTWTSSTMTVVDLAGSERARTAKTAGTTLAEAGKINESLMYLGQCMQMQSDNSALFAAGLDSTSPITPGSKPGLVPFRQCKLTELLFSNSFHERSTPRPTGPKAIMIVTADPRGDFNATSQILKYSALAREVTVPRIPSVASTLGAAPSVVGDTSGYFSEGGRATPSIAGEDLHRLLEEVSLLRAQLEEETRAREAAEARVASVETALDEVEADVRAELCAAFDAELEAERARTLAAMDLATLRNDEHLDRKLDLARAAAIDEAGDEALRARVEELERENAALGAKIDSLTRERDVGRTPSRKLKPLRSRKWEAIGDEENVDPFDL